MYYVLSHNVNIKLQHIDSRLLQHMTLMELGRLEVNNKFLGEPAEFGKNRTLTVQASRPRLTVAC